MLTQLPSSADVFESGSLSDSFTVSFGNSFWTTVSFLVSVTGFFESVSQEVRNREKIPAMIKRDSNVFFIDVCV